MKRIFLIGVPRSGTTLLQSLVGCSPELTTFTESHLFSRCIAKEGRLVGVKRNPVREAKRFFMENGIPVSVMPTAKTLQLFFSSRVASNYLLEVLDQAASHAGFDAWLEKTPRHLLYAERIENARAANDPPIQFIHLVRDGVSVAASLAQASRKWKRWSSPNKGLDRWQREVRISRNLANRPNHHIVIYEQLVADPEATILRLAKLVDLNLSLEHLCHREEILNQIIRSDETWKLETSKDPISPLGRKNTHLTDKELETLETSIDRRDYEYLAEYAAMQGCLKQ